MYDQIIQFISCDHVYLLFRDIRLDVYFVLAHARICIAGSGLREGEGNLRVLRRALKFQLGWRRLSFNGKSVDPSMQFSLQMQSVHTVSSCSSPVHVQLRQLRGEQRGDTPDAARPNRRQELLQCLWAGVGDHRQCSHPILSYICPSL